MDSPLHGEGNSIKVSKKVVPAAKKGFQQEFIYYGSHHLFTYKNSAFGEAFLLVLLEHNASVIRAINSRYLHEENGKYYLITTNEARYKSWYKQFNINTVTGQGVIGDFKGRNRREGPVQVEFEFEKQLNPSDIKGAQQLLNLQKSKLGR